MPFAQMLKVGKKERAKRDIDLEQANAETDLKFTMQKYVNNFIDDQGTRLKWVPLKEDNPPFMTVKEYER